MMAVIQNNAEENESMFDELVPKQSDYKFEIGDMIWGKVKSHPWWPGHIYSEAFASPSVRRSKREGHVLVAFFGDSSYGFFNPAELIPFLPNFSDKSQQTNYRTFLKAVEESVDEASRRCGLSLACKCRNPNNFRPINVKGFFAVDVGDYEPGGAYSSKQIGKARESFSPRGTVGFIRDLALGPTSSEHSGINFVMSKATVLAYRKAVFEEFDETYAEAFGYQSSRPSRKSTQDGSQRLKEPSRAPLSGPLVIAEALGKGTGSVKVYKPKNLGKKERYLSKRRDESDESKATSLATTAGDYVVQKRAPAVSVKPHIPAKREQSGTVLRDSASALSRNVTTGKELTMKKPAAAVSKFSMSGSHQMNGASKVQSSPAISSPVAQAQGYCSHLFEGRSSLNKGKDDLLEKKNSGSDVTVGPISRDGYAEMNDLKADCIRITDSKLFEVFEQSQSQQVIVELHEREHIQVVDTKLHVEGCKMHTDKEDAKKSKVCKRPLGDSCASENSGPLNKKRKKELLRSDNNGTVDDNGTIGELIASEKSVSLNKKKRLKELLRSDDNGMQTHASSSSKSSEEGASMGKVTGKSVQAVTSVTTDDFQKKDDLVSTSLLPDSSSVDLELGQILSDLKTLALNPFHGVKRNPTVIRQVFLRFRSLVYQKSLVSSSSSSAASAAGDSESSQTHPSTSPSESVKEMQQSVKPQKPTRPDDPTTKGERKRGPSDRQEEMAAKKKKKVNDLKLLTSEKKSSSQQKKTIIPDAPPQGESAAPKQPTEFFKKRELPTMLVMRFPPQGTLPSLNELKAKFACFGPLDHSGARVFWNTLSCRVVYRHKLHAQAAYKFAVASSNLFGNTNVRCYIREIGGAEAESGKVVQRADVRDSPVEQKKPPPPPPESQPSGVQLKSILKRSVAVDDAGLVGGDRGGGMPRVKFMLGGEESSRGEQLTNNNLNKNAIFTDVASSSSSPTNGMEFINKNFQKVNVPPPQPPLPIPPNVQFSHRATNNLNDHTEKPQPQLRIDTNINTPKVDISREMMGLLMRCNEVVTNVTVLLGYKPYHPL